MKDTNASFRLGKIGIEHTALKLIPEGSNHYIYDVSTPDGPLIARFYKEDDSGRDSLFGGRLSTLREASNMKLLSEHSIPAPDIVHSENDVLVVNKLPGDLWCEFMEREGHRKSAWLRSMGHLGSSVAMMHKITGKSYGDASGAATLSPGRDSFSARAVEILSHRIRGASPVFNSGELKRIADFFCRRFADVSGQGFPPMFCVTDLHGMNFLVDSRGKPSGFFDLEFCQYAHPALEMYGIRMFLFNYYEQASLAEDAFMEGYRRSGGVYDPSDPSCGYWENTLGLLRLLEFCISYSGVRDGLRDSWSDKFRELMFSGMLRGEMDWRQAALVLAEKTGQPFRAV